MTTTGKAVIYVSTTLTIGIVFLGHFPTDVPGNDGILPGGYPVLELCRCTLPGDQFCRNTETEIYHRIGPVSLSSIPAGNYFMRGGKPLVRKYKEI